jgi:hypothetical protein
MEVPKAIPQSLRCPSCQGPLRPAVLACDSCNLKIEAQFQTNEFAALDEEDLHFLRIFIHTEGRIREMESALGVSYPTVKARLSELKERLHTDRDMIATAQSLPSPLPPETSAQIPPDASAAAAALRELAEGKITYEEAVQRIRGRQTPTPGGTP